MAGVNKATILGNLGADPEARTTQSGKKVVSFSLATSDAWTDKEGQKQQRTEWHSIVIFNEKLGEIAEKFLKKGSSAYVEGKLRKNSWVDEKGIERNNTEVVLEAFNGTLVLVGGAGGSASGEGNVEAKREKAKKK